MPGQNRFIATQYHAELGLPDGRANKEFVVCNNWDLEPLDLLCGLALGNYQRSCKQRVCSGNNWDLEPLDLLSGLALGCYQPSPDVLIV